jgi:hypothetical protein
MLEKLRCSASTDSGGSRSSKGGVIDLGAIAHCQVTAAIPYESLCLDITAKVNDPAISSGIRKIANLGASDVGPRSDPTSRTGSEQGVFGGFAPSLRLRWPETTPRINLTMC